MDTSTPSTETITINGVLVPVAWNPSGRIVCVAVSTFDEKEYRIAGLAESDQWRDYLNKAVSIHGQPYRCGIEQWITVQSFQVIETIPPTDFNKK